MRRSNLLVASILCGLFAVFVAMPIAFGQPAPGSGDDAAPEPPVAEKVDPAEDPEAALDELLKDIDEDPVGKAQEIIARVKEIKDADEEAKPGLIQGLIGMIVMFLTWFTRKFIWKQIPNSALPFVALALGAASETSRLLILGQVAWWEALVSGLVTGAFAVVLWSTVGKRIFPTDK